MHCISFHNEKLLSEKIILSQTASTADKLLLGLFKFLFLQKQSLRALLNKIFKIQVKPVDDTCEGVHIKLQAV